MEIEGLSVVMYRINEMLCAADVAPVVAVVSAKDRLLCDSPVPWAVGTVPFEGKRVPVVDLGARWGNATQRSAHFSIITVRIQDALIGFEVSECTGVATLALDQLWSLPPLVARLDCEPCVWGMAQAEEGLLALIEWESILAPEEQEQLTLWKREQMERIE